MKPKKASRRSGGTVAKLHETQKRIIRNQRHGCKTSAAENEELERIERLLKLEEERDAL